MAEVMDRVTVAGVPDVDGLYLVGRFLGFRDKTPRVVQGQHGATTYQNCDVGVALDGGTIIAVQFGSRADAEAAVGEAVITEDRIALLVENKHGVKDGAGWQFYSGPRSSGPSAFADQFSA